MKGLLSTIFVVLLTLKLVKVIAVSWWVVAIPLLIIPILLIAVAVLAIIFAWFKK